LAQGNGRLTSLKILNSYRTPFLEMPRSAVVAAAAAAAFVAGPYCAEAFSDAMPRVHNPNITKMLANNGTASRLHGKKTELRRSATVTLDDVQSRRHRRKTLEMAIHHPLLFDDLATNLKPEGDADSTSVWSLVTHVKRHKRRPLDHPVGVSEFFKSAIGYQWGGFLAAMAILVPLNHHLLAGPNTQKFHATALLAFIGLGFSYNSMVWGCMGVKAGIMWFTGFLLEFIFSIENVFVFHIVVKAFGTPIRLAQKAIFVVVCVQIVFEMVFFMGLASRVRELTALPYLLGLWLLYVGFQAARDDGHDDFKLKDSVIMRLWKVCLGDRLLLTYKDDLIFFVEDERICVSLMFPLIGCLLAVDFALEVDVTLTKIEALPNEYIAFTSSALAALAVPELFCVAKRVFEHYFLLKYGISFVLVFFGVRMLFHDYIDIPDLVGCAIMVVVMALCMLLSEFLQGPVTNNSAAKEELNQKTSCARLEDAPDVKDMDTDSADVRNTNNAQRFLDENELRSA